MPLAEVFNNAANQWIVRERKSWCSFQAAFHFIEVQDFSNIWVLNFKYISKLEVGSQLKTT